jgi:hypothetical protein
MAPNETMSATGDGGSGGVDPYAMAMALASAWLAYGTVIRTSDDERQRKMRRVFQKKVALVSEAWPDELGDVNGIESVRKALGECSLDLDQRKTLLIDLSFSDPFAPYELKYDEDWQRDAIKDIAKGLVVDLSFVDAISATRKAAARAHHRRNIAFTVAFGIGGAVVLALGGWMAAPVIAGYLGASAGLAGAAATAHGLALLGGGTLAAGGMGMAGGMAIVTGGGAAIGGLAGGGGMLLYQLGAAGAENELLKLQVTFKTVLLDGQLHVRKAQEVIRGLVDRELELKALLKEETKLNDSKSRKLKELRQILESVERSREWMEAERQAA